MRTRIKNKLLRELYGMMNVLIQKPSDRIPDRLNLVVCPPRTGSTVLTDLLRSHPFIEFSEDCFLSYMLGSAARYPVDLSNLSDGRLLIKQNFNLSTRIPLFNTASIYDKKSMDDFNNEYFSLEKIHPQFFGSAAYRLINCIKRIQKIKRDKIEINFIYLCRDPLNTMRSFIAYNRRNPEWGNRIIKDPSLLFSEHLASLEFIDKLSDLHPGFVINYEGFTNEGKEDILANLYAYIWRHNKNIDNDFLKIVAMDALKSTSKNMRPQSLHHNKTTEENVNSSNSTKDNKIFEENKAVVDKIYATYHRIQQKISQ